MVNAIEFVFCINFLLDFDYEKYHLDSMVLHTTSFPREEYTKYIFHADNFILSNLEEIGLGYDNESIYIHSSTNV